MTAPTPPPAGYSVLPTPTDAMLAWLSGVARRRPGYHGAIFTNSDRAADPYLRAADRVMPPNTVRHRTFASFAVWQASNCDLHLEILRNDSDICAYTTPKHFLCFDKPVAWNDQGRIARLIQRFAVPGSHIVSVGSPIVLPTQPDPKPPVDYFAITRALSG